MLSFIEFKHLDWRVKKTSCLSALLLNLLFLSGCSGDLECGPGTLLSAGQCVPLQAVNCTGDGVRFENGQCIVDVDDFCGPGTVLSEDGSECVAVMVDIPDLQQVEDIPSEVRVDLSPQEDPAFNDWTHDSSEQDEGFTDLDSGTDSADIQDGCLPDLVPGQDICVTGQAFNFLNLTPLPSDASPPIQVQVKDLLEAISDPASAPLAEAPVGPGGVFQLPGLEGADRSLLFIVGEEESSAPEGPGSFWQRTLGGLISTDPTRTVYEDIQLYAVPRAPVLQWNELLSLEPEESLDATGFALIRVVTLSGEDLLPTAGAVVECVGCEGVSVSYFQDINLTGFYPDEMPFTGPSGMVLITGAGPQDVCTATMEGRLAIEQVPCGTSPYRASIGLIVLLES